MGRGRGGAGGGTGENPPNGAIIYFSLKTAPKGESTIEILDSAGKHIRTYSTAKHEPLTSPPDPDSEKPRRELEVTAGLNRFVWDLRSEWSPRIAGYYLFDYEAGTHGVLQLPGQYQVKLTVNGKTYTTSLEVKPDPRVTFTLEDMRKQYDLSTRIHRDLNHIYEAVLQMRDVREQLKAIRERSPKIAEARR